MRWKKNELFNAIPIILISFSYSQDLLPRSSVSSQIVHHNGFSLSYSETHEQPDWVYYVLSSSKVNGNYPRKDNFRVDKSILTGSAELNDYKGSGFDRGHLVPAADMKWSKLAMSESFYMSNISPQKPGFNRGIWKKLESHVRQWAIDNRRIYIVTGGILKGKLNSIGINAVSIPQYYYKVILDYSEPEIKGIGFILPNKKSNQNLQAYAVTIDQVEEVTGINFFYELPSKIEEEIESNFNLSKWNFK